MQLWKAIGILMGRAYSSDGSRVPLHSFVLLADMQMGGHTKFSLLNIYFR